MVVTPVPWPSRDSDTTTATFVTAKIHLMETRGMTEASAIAVLQSHKCEECECAIHREHDGECECPCHCECCCTPLFRCIAQCPCNCNCHYEPQREDSDPEEDFDDEKLASTGMDEIVTETPEVEAEDSQLGTTNQDGLEQGHHKQQQPQRGTDDGAESNRRAPTTEDSHAEPGDMNDIGNDDEDEDETITLTNTKMRPDDDEDMEEGKQLDNSGTDGHVGVDNQGPPLPTGDIKSKAKVSKQTQQPMVLFTLMAERLPNEPRPTDTPDISEESILATGRFFTLAYDSVVKASTVKKVANKLPALTTDEQALLLQYAHALVVDHKASFQRVWSALRDVSVASTRSTWSFSKIVQDRIAAATIPKSVPANIWASRAHSGSTSIEHTTQEIYLFDEAIYDAATITRLRPVCEAAHGFAEGTRAPTADEWAIMLGIMDGNILARAHPQFLKRCCTMRQFAWFHRQLFVRAEGELWAPLPTNTKIYNVNQSSRRLIAAITQSATHQKWPDPRLSEILGAVKVASYDQTRHSLHLHF